MWILTFLPDYATHSILTVGILGIIAGFVLGFIPLINAYKLPIQIVSILLLSLGLYLEGGMTKEAEWQLKAKELEVKISKAEAESAKVDTQVVTKIITKKQVIKEKGDDIVKYIDREVVKYDNTCPIPESVIKSHNAAATGDLMILSTELHNKLATPSIKLAPKK